ncbi:MAG: c-type cytochrome [Aquabacterium sp.]|nr:c-type cytochrome [Aquabacterium sp.]
MKMLHLGALAGALLSLLLAGCAVEWQNREAQQEMAALSKPPGSVYTGWRVFQDKCAACHTPNATGGSQAPNLLLAVREMGPNQFVSVVLKRYDWGMPNARTGAQLAPTSPLVEAMVQRQDGALTMPAWEGEPRVSAHIVDLYAYLLARAEGTQGPGRPAK